jgi:hypothetical protein
LLQENSNDIAVLIDRPIQIMLLPLNGDKDFVAMPAWSKNSCGLAVAVFQQSTQSFLITNRCSTGDFLARKRNQELIAFSLMMTILLVWSIGDRRGE